MMRNLGLALILVFIGSTVQASECLEIVARGVIEDSISDRAQKIYQEHAQHQEKTSRYRNGLFSVGMKFFDFFRYRNAHDFHPWWFLKHGGLPQKVRKMAKLSFDHPETQDTIESIKQAVTRYRSYQFDLFRLSVETLMLHEKVSQMQDAADEIERTGQPVVISYPIKAKIEDDLSDSPDRFKVTEYLYRKRVMVGAEETRKRVKVLQEQSNRLKLKTRAFKKRRFMFGRHQEQAERWWELAIVSQELEKLEGNYEDAQKSENCATGGDGKLELVDRMLQFRDGRLGAKDIQCRDDLQAFVDGALYDPDLAPESLFFRAFTRQVAISEWHHYRRKDIEYSDTADDANGDLFTNDRVDLNLIGERTNPFWPAVRSTVFVYAPSALLAMIIIPQLYNSVQFYAMESSNQKKIAQLSSEAEYRTQISEFMDRRFPLHWPEYHPLHNPDEDIEEELKEFAGYRIDYLRSTVAAVNKSNAITAYATMPGDEASVTEGVSLLAGKVMNIAVLPDRNVQSKLLNDLLLDENPILHEAIKEAYQFAATTISDSRSDGANMREVIMGTYNKLTRTYFNALPQQAPAN